MENYKLIIPGCELNDDDIPNSNLTYDIYWDGKTLFKALLCKDIRNQKTVSFEDAPKFLYYKLTKPFSEITAEETKQILEYRGLNAIEYTLEITDVFMEFSLVEKLKITGKDVLNWLGSDHLNVEELAENVAELLNNEWKIDQAIEDILNSKE